MTNKLTREKLKKKFGKHHWSCTKILCGVGCKFNKDLWEHVDKAISQTRKEVLEEHKKIFKWLLGYKDFPQRKEGEGAYYWRIHLRTKLRSLNKEK